MILSILAAMVATIIYAVGALVLFLALVLSIKYLLGD
jgi:hypothetical protein